RVRKEGFFELGFSDMTGSPIVRGLIIGRVFLARVVQPLRVRRFVGFLRSSSSRAGATLMPGVLFESGPHIPRSVMRFFSRISEMLASMAFGVTVTQTSG